MSKFKLGDIVRCIGHDYYSSDRSYVIGDLYRVSIVNESGNSFRIGTISLKNNTFNSWHVDRFVLAKPKQQRHLPKFMLPIDKDQKV